MSRCVYLKGHHVFLRSHLKRSFSKVYFFRKIWSNYVIYPGLVGFGDRNFSNTMIFITSKKFWLQKKWFSNFCGKNVMCLKDVVTRSLGSVFGILIVRIRWKTWIKNLKLDKNCKTCSNSYNIKNLWKKSTSCWPLLTVLHPWWGEMNLILFEKNLIEKNCLGSHKCSWSIQFESWRFCEFISGIRCYWDGRRNLTKMGVPESGFWPLKKGLNFDLKISPIVSV